MMKPMKLLCVSLIVLLLFSFCACSNGNSNNNQSDLKPNKNEQQVNNDSISLDSATQIGDIAEIKIVNAFVSEDVIPPKPSSVYRHYEASDGCTYFVIVMDIKNIGSNSVAASDIIKATLDVDNTEYSAFTVVETDDGASLDKGTLTYIDALEVVRVYQMFSVPSSVDLQNFSLTIINGTETYSSDFSLSSFESKVKEISIGEIITDNDTVSLTVDSIEFKDTLYPPKASGYYNYYEAESGKTFLVVKMTVNNLKGTDMKYDSIAGVSCVYNQKYNYSFFTVLEEDGGQDLNGYPSQYAISPLDTGVVYYLAEVPEQVEDGPVEITFYVAGDYYSFSV